MYYNPLVLQTPLLAEKVMFVIRPVLSYVYFLQHICHVRHWLTRWKRGCQSVRRLHAIGYVPMSSIYIRTNYMHSDISKPILVGGAHCQEIKVANLYPPNTMSGQTLSLGRSSRWQVVSRLIYVHVRILLHKWKLERAIWFRRCQSDCKSKLIK